MDAIGTLERVETKAPPRGFKVGQIWEARNPDNRLSPDHWRIEAITDHPLSPVIARAVSCDAIRAFGLDGTMDGDGVPTALDLVTLVREA